MIASSGTGTAGPLMGTMHSPQIEGETKDKGSNAVLKYRSKQKYRVYEYQRRTLKSDSGTKKTKENITGEERTRIVTNSICSIICLGLYVIKR